MLMVERAGARTKRCLETLYLGFITLGQLSRLLVFSQAAASTPWQMPAPRKLGARHSHGRAAAFRYDPSLFLEPAFDVGPSPTLTSREQPGRNLLSPVPKDSRSMPYVTPNCLVVLWVRQ